MNVAALKIPHYFPTCATKFDILHGLMAVAALKCKQSRKLAVASQRSGAQSLEQRIFPDGR